MNKRIKRTLKTGCKRVVVIVPKGHKATIKINKIPKGVELVIKGNGIVRKPPTIPSKNATPFDIGNMDVHMENKPSLVGNRIIHTWREILHIRPRDYRFKYGSNEKMDLEHIHALFADGTSMMFFPDETIARQLRNKSKAPRDLIGFVFKRFYWCNWEKEVSHANSSMFFHTPI